MYQDGQEPHQRYLGDEMIEMIEPYIALNRNKIIHLFNFIALRLHS